MKAAVFYGKHDLRVQEIEKPTAKAGQVLIKVMACGICGTDVHIHAGAQGATECNPPVILGHEFAGEVVEVGAAGCGWCLHLVVAVENWRNTH